MSAVNPEGIQQTGDAPPAPRHIAIIMDGNGRWATSRGLPRTEGHRRGVQSLQNTVTAALDLGIRHLTLFGFSSENWSRPPEEVEMLFGLFRTYVKRNIGKLVEQDVRVRVIGRRAGLPGDIQTLIDDVEARTRANRSLQMIFAFNYGGRDEIARAARRIAERVAAGEIKADSVNEAAIAEELDTHDVPDPDLVIRTSGEMRLSNFLLWQSAYSELVFLPVYWPDFSQEDLEEAIAAYSGRKRRYGGLSARTGG